MSAARVTRETAALRLVTVPEHHLAAERARRHLYNFLREFWDTIIPDPFIGSWHIAYICEEIERVFERVERREAKLHDLVINVPPGTTKSTILAKMFPVWAWVRDPTLSIITGSYSADLALEHADASRDIINSPRFRALYPHLQIRHGQDSKSKYQIAYRSASSSDWLIGGKRYATSVGGTITGLHGHIIIIDDPINPKQAEAASPALRTAATTWLDRTLSSRKTDKNLTPMILIMQRLHQADPTGHWLETRPNSVRHVCLPGMITGDPNIKISPPELAARYVNGLLDPARLSHETLTAMEAELGQYGFAGQVLQHPVPPGGGMFKPDNLVVVPSAPRGPGVRRAIYWDKAGTAGGGAYTVGVEMVRVAKTPQYVITRITRGQWASSEREQIIKAEADRAGRGAMIVIEQEPGSGGLESAQASVRNLAGHQVRLDRPTGNKALRADPFSVQVNSGNVGIADGPWLRGYIDELRYFPMGRYKDQVDASAGAFNYLATGKVIGAW